MNFRLIYPRTAIQNICGNVDFRGLSKCWTFNPMAAPESIGVSTPGQHADDAIPSTVTYGNIWLKLLAKLSEGIKPHGENTNSRDILTS